MNADTLHLYRRFRELGYPAADALRRATTVLAFDELEAQGLVRITASPESAEDVARYGKPVDQRCGAWFVEAEYFDGETWQHADGSGMCSLPNPKCPFENNQVPDLMASAVRHGVEQMEEA